jgi:hypothetical protein
MRYMPKDVDTLAIAALAVAACLTSFLLEAHVGFSLWDGGYLWYGVQRVMHGEVPIRDFMAYDPGRYYWAATLMLLFHAHGIVAVRAATLAFSAFGVMCAGWLIMRGGAGSRFMRLGLSAFGMFMCMLWMVPWWKGYDAALSIILISSLVRVLEWPKPSRFLMHGIAIGLAAVLGRNHGLYGAVACVLAMPMLMMNTGRVAWSRCIPAWIGGMFLGFAPILVSCVFDHSFAAMFWESIRYILFEYKGTNLPLPVPWPWIVRAQHVPFLALIWPWLVGCIFIALPVFSISGMLSIFHKLRGTGAIANPVFVACVLTSIPYLNVAFSRADVSHLAQAVFPCLIGMLVCPWSGWSRVFMRWVGFPLLTAVTLWVTLPLHPGYLKWIEPDWRQVDVRGELVWMDAGTAELVKDINALADSHITPSGTALSAPVWPGVYALLGIRSPVWEIYPILPRSDLFQDQEIVRLQKAKPELVLIYDFALDGHDQLRYERSHPRIWHYISAHFHRVQSPDREPLLQVYLPGAKD